MLKPFPILLISAAMLLPALSQAQSGDTAAAASMPPSATAPSAASTQSSDPLIERRIEKKAAKDEYKAAKKLAKNELKAKKKAADAKLKAQQAESPKADVDGVTK